MQKKISTSAYKKLKKWVENFWGIANKVKYDEYYKIIHDDIVAGDYSKLDDREQKILNGLLNDVSGIFTRENLYEYYLGFNDIISDEIGEQNKRKEIADRYEGLLSKFEFQEADEFFDSHEEGLDVEICEDLQTSYLKKFFQEKLDTSNNIDDVIQIYEQYKKDFDLSCVEEWIIGMIRFDLEKKYQTLLVDYQFQAIDIFIEKYENYIDIQEYKEMRDSVLIQEYEDLLSKFEFQEADSLFFKFQKYLDIGIYEKKKSEYVEGYFKDKSMQTPDQEQSEAIGAIGSDILVSARAGSGKTQTIFGRAVFLCEKYDVNPEEILILCFNKNASDNVRERVKKYISEFENAMTFHSFAHKIVSPQKNSILFNRNGEFSRKDYSVFIKKIIEERAKSDREFKKRIYDFFRKEDETIDESLSETRHFQSQKDRYLYLRNENKITLNGDHVKSRGEKWIADFLFEHGVTFWYEQKFNFNEIKSVAYHPDFMFEINNQKYVLEHWGIDEFDNAKKVDKDWTKSWDEYREEMQDKRKIFNNDSVKEILIETSIRNINYRLEIDEQRKEFEKFLKNIFESHDISLKKEEESVLVERAWKKNTFTQITRLISTFISWMQNREFSEGNLRNVMNEMILNEKQIEFCNIGLEIYGEYLNKLGEKIDFNILLKRAVEKIDANKLDVSNYKHILIDEFQDFSHLFQSLINAIREKNPEVKLFCVGDSWQLINGFAGSDLDIFFDFKDEANVKTISTCYRSVKKIVDCGNQFANANPTTFIGKNSSHRMTGDGWLEKYFIDDEYIENRQDYILKSGDEQFRDYFKISRKDGEDKFLAKRDFIKARLLKKIYEIAKNNNDKSLLYLHRNIKMRGLDLVEWKKYLRELLQRNNINLSKDVDFKTMHSSKGLEADVVVVLDVCERIIPSIHPTNELFEVFGRSRQKILDEEKRLFYVAITRAKEKLHLITENGKKSEFLDQVTG